jgi:hypothetical protein
MRFIFIHSAARRPNSTLDVRESKKGGVGMPLRGTQRRSASRTHQGAVTSIDMPSACIDCDSALLTNAGSQSSSVSPICAGTYQDCEYGPNNGRNSRVFDHEDGKSGENDKRYRHHHLPSAPERYAGQYLSFKFQPFYFSVPVHDPITTTVQP